MLAAIGLSDLEEQVYLALLRGTAENDLPSRGVVSPHELTATLDGLAAKRLLRRSAETGRYEPVPPKIALPALIAERVDAIRRSKRAADDLLSGFLHGLGAGQAGVAEAVTADQAGHRLREIMEYAVGEVLLADAGATGLPLALGPGAPPLELARLTARGVRVKVVCADEAAAHWRTALPEAMVRTVPEIPASFFLADGRHGAVVLAGGSIAMITGPTLLTVLAEVAAALWRQGNERLLGADDRELLRMLASGMKDEAIARHTGIGLRTVKRKIAELFELLGAETRFQAGLQAFRQGLL